MLRLYDTRNRRIERIVPEGSRSLRMYTCGPTVYRSAHVGNLRSYLLSDLIRRVSERQRVRVVVCRNITDVGHLVDDAEIDPSGEDKVLAQARAEGRSALEISRFYEGTFLADTAALNIRPPEHSPRASETIDLMIEMIAKLIEKGHAYAVPDGSVFFDAASFPTYGEISGNRLDQLRPGHRVEGVDPRKRFHADWALWKPSDRELTWETPWGRGFPGWHIECSAMSLRFLGERIDVHTGGIDLRFPHHEDERAQSDATAGHEVVRHWVHGEHLLFDGRKMSKSTGNVVLLKDVADAGLDPLAVRLALLEHRHRQQMNLTWDTLRAADRTLRRWRSQVAEWSESPSSPMPADRVSRIEAAFDDDLDTPLALRLLRELERDGSVAPGSRFEAFLHLDQILALDLSLDIGRSVRPRSLPGGAAELLEQRARARDAQDWSTSDRLRDELAALGVKVADTPDGQTWS
ncbi:cysteine--tRNA ligase [Streptosporangium sp. NBC_01755]|uniref:cysteine--tRNA ligase n=1 Tax=unclassified Streptosporangium TaxID=2632669 RepID=UPI002DDB8CDF|nr:MULTISPECIES: cysteine--tRNA ligase [unclassified Streptosporangium]WSA26223.1 cysteine--tRNA ligase [Streptosporangium sp. NBC_01810]WSD02349.1 cysteine--tRNA ligase [Streptosporangium sp. NBC_01755]